MSKMGISTLQSYRGAQIFEAVGLIASSSTALHRHRRRASRASASTEMAARRSSATAAASVARRSPSRDSHADPGGQYQWRRAARCRSTRSSRSAIVSRFVTGAMSFGSISKEAHETLAIAMNRIGGRSNSGEGGEDPAPLRPRPQRRSAAQRHQAGRLGRFGVTAEYLVNAEELQIKIAQGAKPGEGGQLPGPQGRRAHRPGAHSTPGRHAHLPAAAPRHLLDRGPGAAHLRPQERQPRGPVSRQARVRGRGRHRRRRRGQGQGRRVLISGYDGGTGASPLSSIKHAACPGSSAWPRRSRCWCATTCATASGCRPTASSRPGATWSSPRCSAPRSSASPPRRWSPIGCIMMRKCHLNTCPVGIATQDPELRKRFTGKARARGQLLLRGRGAARDHGRLGFRTFDEMVGRVDLLDVDERWSTTGRRGPRSQPILPPCGAPARRMAAALHHPAAAGQLDDALDSSRSCAGPRTASTAAGASRPADRNTNRTVGTMLGRSPAHGSARACPTTAHVELHRLRRPELRRLLAPGITLSSKARPTTTSARAWPGAASWSTRPRAPGSCPRRTSSSATCSTAPPAASLLPRPGRRALRGPQQRRPGGGRGRRRPRLRVHDRRRGRGPRAAPAATSPPA
jgi:glutamate synthase (NADPH) large chain